MRLAEIVDQRKQTYLQTFLIVVHSGQLMELKEFGRLFCTYSLTIVIRGKLHWVAYTLTLCLFIMIILQKAFAGSTRH